ncbi:MAG: hypothetical protein J4F35_22595, partial [Candidatus Latescibacteria bacterium]|nr:hypothetical protein [Candidatus Latescibacterota bacterium]
MSKLAVADRVLDHFTELWAERSGNNSKPSTASSPLCRTPDPAQLAQRPDDDGQRPHGRGAARP